jgi:hypothetical protein
MSYSKFVLNINGHEVHIRDMTNRHLINIIRKLRKSVTDSADLRLDNIENINLSVLSIDEYLESTVPQYETLLIEAFRRGIPDSELVEQVNPQSAT